MIVLKKRSYVLTALLSLFVVGCEAVEPYGEIENAIVVDKKTEEQCARGCWNNYFITLEKNGNKIELEVDTENEYNAFILDNTVNVSYDRSFFVIDVEFPLIQDIKEKTVDNDKK